MKKLFAMVLLVTLLLGPATLSDGRGALAAATVTSAGQEEGAPDVRPAGPTGDLRLGLVPMEMREPGEHPELGYLSLVVIAIMFGGAAIAIYRRYR